MTDKPSSSTERNPSDGQADASAESGDGGDSFGKLDRRSFIGATAVAAVGAAVTGMAGKRAGAAETGGRAVVRPGSDLMVQVLRDIGIEYIAANPGSSFEGIHESLVNYSDHPNHTPELITCLHEESAVDMAHGYGKAEGKPMAVALHGTVGLLHGGMAIYQAFNDQTPILMIVGRDDHFIQAHTANDMAGISRAFTKWDAHPKTLEESLTALQEAYRQATTPPCGPVLVVMDTELQKQNAGDLQVPKYVPPQIAGIDESEAREIAKGLLGARNPHIAVGRLRTPEGVKNAVALAELVGATVSTSAFTEPMSFPHPHPLCGPGAKTKYDYGLGLEADAETVALRGPKMSSLRAQRDVTGIGFGDMRGGSGRLGRPRRKPMAKRTMTIDAEASLPLIIEEVNRQVTPARTRRIRDRIAKNAAANHRYDVETVAKALETKRIGWDNTPVTTARMYGELWPHIKNEDWCLSSPSNFTGNHHVAMWTHRKHYSYLGGQGAGGIGYSIGASMGAGLAAKSRDRIVVDFNGDGDINYAPGSLWTAAHHDLPVLVVVHNNHAWNMELMLVEYMCGVRGRSTVHAATGTTLRGPYLKYAKMAEGYGVEAEGPISDPVKMAAAYKRGIEVVKSGRPYLIDLVAEPR